MILVDEYAALPALAGRPHLSLAGEVLALTYSRAYRLTRALLDPGPGRLQTRGRFTRLVEALSAEGHHALHEPTFNGASLAERYRTKYVDTLYSQYQWSGYPARCVIASTDGTAIQCTSYSTDWTVVATPTAQSSTTTYEFDAVLG